MRRAGGPCLENPGQVDEQCNLLCPRKKHQKAADVPFSLWFTGIQKNVQALYYVLKHPLVYRDAKPRLDSMQKPYVPHKKVMRPRSGGRERLHWCWCLQIVSTPTHMLQRVARSRGCDKMTVPAAIMKLWGLGKLLQCCFIHLQSSVRV